MREPVGAEVWIRQLAQVLFLTAVGCGFSLLGTPDAQAAGAFATRLAGTYFVIEGDDLPAPLGNVLLTLTANGVAVAASASQARENFSEEHGVWKRVPGTRKILITTLSFDFGDPGGTEFDFILRHDFEGQVDGDFQTIEGTVTLTFFEPEENPIDPGRPPDTGGFSFKAERLTVSDPMLELPQVTSR